eukprot:TRINITY_DN6051_c0_g2_i2.p1 TRINITY_DN6051_c0_g2~~TRINITY_DN6051_c0_g2_i2.p1  ORF type:complete len:108 (+),score=37.85 TRINITY_DN6051_c0_g2_i2:38-325(+)
MSTKRPSFKLNPTQKEEAVKKFKEVDKNSSGTVDKVELENLIHQLQPKLKGGLFKRVLELHFSDADKDLSGQIDLEEFLDLYAKVLVEAGLLIKA